MASLNDYIRSLGGGGKSSVKPSNQYVTPQGQGTNQSGSYGSGILSQANYLNPQAAPQAIQPVGGTSMLSSSYSPYGSSGAAGVNTSGLQDTARSLISGIQNAYHSLTGSLQPVVQDKVNQYLQNYDTQSNDLQKAYTTSQNQLGGVYNARGLADSGFYGSAQQDAGNTYNQSVDALNQDKSQKLGAIGQYAQGLQSSANAAADQYGQYLPNLGQYSAADLQGLNSSLQGALPGIQSQVAGMGTNQDFLNTLNQYAPQANQGASQLATKLQQLVTSSAPIFAKKQIASGLVKSANLQDQGAQSYWQSYFDQLLNGTA